MKPDGKRERKGFFLNQGLLKKIGDGYGKLTEVKDFLDALAAGLPTRLDKNGKEIPGKEYYEYRYAKGLQNKAKVLYFAVMYSSSPASRLNEPVSNPV